MPGRLQKMATTVLIMAHDCLIIMVWHVEPSPTITDLSMCVVASPLQHMLLAVAAFRGVQTYEKIRSDRPEPSSVRKEIYSISWDVAEACWGNDVEIASKDIKDHQFVSASTTKSRFCIHDLNHILGADSHSHPASSSFCCHLKQ